MNDTGPMDGQDVMWLTLTFLAQNADAQERHLPWPILERERVGDPSQFNPLLALYWVFLEYRHFWTEAFPESVGLLERLLAIFESIVNRELENIEYSDLMLSREGFRSRSEWVTIRKYARLTLSREGMPEYPLSSVIQLADYVEIPPYWDDATLLPSVIFGHTTMCCAKPLRASKYIDVFTATSKRLLGKIGAGNIVTGDAPMLNR